MYNRQDLKKSGPRCCVLPWTIAVDLLRESHNAPVPYPTMHHFATEMCTRVHTSVAKWCIVGYRSDALWDVWDRNVIGLLVKRSAAFVWKSRSNLLRGVRLIAHFINIGPSVLFDHAARLYKTFQPRIGWVFFNENLIRQLVQGLPQRGDINVVSTWWRHQMKTFSALLALWAGYSPVTGELPSQRPVTRSFDIFFDLCLNKR